MSSSATPISPVGVTDEPSREERVALLHRILESPVFNKSTRLRSFLKYISDCDLRGRPEEAHEQIIGHVVFSRPIDYNPADDNIVRVSARQLRSKLREYFDTVGKGEIWILEIPKGSYLPVFRRRELAPAVGKVQGPAPRTPKASQTRIVIVALSLMLVGSLLVDVWLWNKIRTHPPAIVSTSSNFIEVLFGASTKPVEIVPSDSRLVLMQSLLRRPFSFQEYVDHSYLRLPKSLSRNPSMRQFWGFLSTRQIWNMGDVGVTHEIRASLLGSGAEVIVRSSRNMAVRDFMSGNFILLGGRYSNPWEELFSRDLNFRFARPQVGGLTEIRNAHPRPGEQKGYSKSGTEWKDGMSYARVALVPNLGNSGRVLLIAGMGMQATEAAADYLLSPASILNLHKVIGTHNTEYFPNFELLLQTSSIDGTPDSARVVAVRVYTSSP